MKLRTLLAFISTVSSCAALAVDSFTLTDGGVSWTVGGLSGERLTDQGGQGALTVNGVVSPLQSWFWYRTDADGREYALSNQTDSSIGVNTASVNYVEPAGATDGALLFGLQYELHQTGPNTATGDITFGAFALTQQPHQVDIFSYTDVDFASQTGAESALVSGGSNEVQTVQDGATGSSMVYTATTRSLLGYQMAGFADLRTALADGGKTALDNTGSPFGPGDWTGAFQWSAQVKADRVGFIGHVHYDWSIVPEPSMLLASLGLLVWLLRPRSQGPG